MTFAFFPILVILAFMADKDYCGGKKKEKRGTELGELFVAVLGAKEALLLKLP